MRPYYEHGGITIYHGDCRDVLPGIGPIDVVVTDPPYGIALDTDYSRFGTTVISGRAYDRVEGDAAPMDLSFLFHVGRVQVVWGANNWPQAIPFDAQRDGWICWDKRVSESADALFGSPFELAVVIGKRTYKMIRLQHCGFKNADGDRSGRFHPTQKPVALMARILRLFRGSVVDPFMGSGTTLRAAKDAGRVAIGIDTDERYCEVAANRMQQEVLSLGSV